MSSGFLLINNLEFRRLVFSRFQYVPLLNGIFRPTMQCKGVEHKRHKVLNRNWISESSSFRNETTQDKQTWRALSYNCYCLCLTQLQAHIASGMMIVMLNVVNITLEKRTRNNSDYSTRLKIRITISAARHSTFEYVYLIRQSAVLFFEKDSKIMTTMTVLSHEIENSTRLNASFY